MTKCICLSSKVYAGFFQLLHSSIALWYVYDLFLYGAAELDILAVAVSLLWKNPAEAWK